MELKKILLSIFFVSLISSAKADIIKPAENYHQDYYEKNFIRYLMYKNACKRDETLKRIWN